MGPWAGHHKFNTDSMKKVERANTVLEKIAASTGMSEAGKEWLIAVTDPMHDGPLCVTGYPDQDDAPTVLQVVKQSVTLASPYTGGQANDTWGFHVMLDDYLINDYSFCDAPGGTSPFFSNVQGNVVQYDSTTSNGIQYLYRGGVNVVAFDETVNQAANVTTITGPAPSGAANRLMKRLQVDPVAFLAGKTRCISQGVEIVDTTAELYKAGALLVYENPTVKTDPEAYRFVVYASSMDKRKSDASNADGTLFATMDVLPPLTEAEAMILPKSQQWDAREGAYVVQTMSSINNPASFITSETSLYTRIEQAFPVAAPDVYSGVAFLPQYAVCTIPNNTGSVFFPGNKKIPFNRKGIIVTGLTPQSTFKLNYNSVVERVISSQDKSLATLAKPSPCWDPVALGVYSQIVSEMPIGTAFRNNGLGDWFLGVVDEIANVVTTIGRPILGAAEAYRAERNVPSGAMPKVYNQPQLAQQTVKSTSVSKPLPQPPKKKAPKPLPPIPTPQQQQASRRRRKPLPQPPSK